MRGVGFRTGAEVRFTSGHCPTRRARPGARQAISRFAQEALSNVARHARAREVAVSLGTQDDRLVLTVQDDGSGFIVDGPPRGMGMGSIAARAAEVGGIFKIASVPGRRDDRAILGPLPAAVIGAPIRLRAIVWGVVLLAASASWLSRGTGALPLAAAVAAIAAIAVARYSLAVYRLVPGSERHERHLDRPRRRSPGRDPQPEGVPRVVSRLEGGRDCRVGRGTAGPSRRRGTRTSYCRIC